jgi:RimJ/RimL family protein N-acetyltransferase
MLDGDEPVLRRDYAETGFGSAMRALCISLVIAPGNTPSRQIADKCGFQLEGTARGAFFNGGRNLDLLIYSLLRDDPRPWHKSD